jgi:hypothetical protein
MAHFPDALRPSHETDEEVSPADRAALARAVALLERTSFAATLAREARGP